MMKGEQEVVDNRKVLDRMQVVHADPDLYYGYRRMTMYLKLLGYLINHKKVYRLMKQNHMIRSKKRSTIKYVQYRIVAPEGPLQLIEMDIKMVWIAAERKHAYILTVIDVFTRVVLGWHAGMSITQHTVKEVWTRVIENHFQVHDMRNSRINIEVRKDNDSRFCAKAVQLFFAQNYLNQVFTHPYTPQENGHIESFHSIIGP
jgi:putative transposase